MSWATNNLTFRFEWSALLWFGIAVVVLLLIPAFFGWLRERYDEDWLP